MGDFLSPKRRDIVDKLRRRIDLYRRRQVGMQQRYEYRQKTQNEQERKHALILRQRILDSKAKKSSKGKAKSDSTQSDHRNQIIQKRLKSKLDGNAIESQQNNPENLYRFEDDETNPSKTIKTSSSTNIDGLSSSVSINIVHQINGANSQQEQKISTNVTVNQTINNSQSETDLSGQSGVECKVEPNEESGNISNSDSNNDLDSELDHLLSTYGEDIPQEIIDELNKFEEICRSVKDSEGNDSGLNSSSSDAGNSSMFASNMYADPNPGPGQVRTPPYQRAQPHIPSSTLGEGGLAAETLKQMAAQHQQQQHHPNQEQYGVKSTLDPFSDITASYGTPTRNGYSTSEYQQYLQQQQQRAGSSGPYNGQSSIGYPSKPDMSTGYNSNISNNNKQISHYAHNVASSQSDSTTPSSLQQLQNQVAHFNQGPPHMEITQTQHMQVSDGSHRMQMSQTQHVQVRQPLQNISLTQQQGFSASPQSQNFMGNDPMSMQQQPQPQQQQQSHQQQQQQQQQQMMSQSKIGVDPRQAHMHQYMNRPPPEYKMQPSGMSSAMSSNNMGPNPLQTIQNMVNQTSTLPTRGYSPVKSEASDSRMQSGMRNVQMSAMQQQMAAAGSMNPVGMSLQQAQLGYSNQAAVQRQSSYPGAIGQMTGRPQRPSAPNYTSAIMRNQRPPNVNIGPDGLNISQPRTQEWPRGMMPGPRSVAPVSSAGMMQYRSYSSDGTNSAAAAAQMQMQQQQGQRSMHMDSMHMDSQQAAMMQQSNVHTQQMMMQQQQRMHMSQQMGQSSHSGQPTSYNMTSQPPSSYPQTSTAQDDFLNLLDSAPNQSTDFFDVQTSGGGTDSNWYDIDDILGNTK